MMNTTKRTPVPLEHVHVTDAYCMNAFARERAYLLSLSAERLLAGFYENAGIKKPYVRYGGWENLLIGGHTLGHYLSALSLAYASSGDHALAEQIGKIISGLSECQSHVGTGLIWGATPVGGGIEAQFNNVELGRTDIRTQAWVPWYTLHKLLSGLIETAKLHIPIAKQALGVACRLGDWVVARTSRWDKRTRRRVLSVEYGGMNDCLYELYAITGTEAYACAAHAFDEDALFSRMLEGERDLLDGLHANTTIPKFLGALNRYRVLHGKTLQGKRVDASLYLRAAEAFFRCVTEHHTYVTGGNSEWEHFGKDDVLDAERTNCNCETCNVYNMLKLARGLFAETGDARYLDYYDNAFVNAVLSSQHPETGMTTYFQPMAGGFFKVFSRPYDKFWCCTGSGMENFSKLGDGIFYTEGERVIVARYLSARMDREGTSLEISADLPLQSDVTVRVGGERTFPLLLRIPDWCRGASLTKNGEPIPLSGAFAQAEVRGGDVLCLRLDFGVTLHGLPDFADVFAFRYGNAVLSADLGTEDMRETETGVEVTIPARRILPTERLYFEHLQEFRDHPDAFFERDGEKFLLKGADVPLTFGLHYKRYQERYAIYFYLCEGERGAEEMVREALDAVQPGYGQYETDALHEMRERHSVSATSERTYRYAKAGGWFAYDLRVDPAARNVLEITLSHADNGKPLRISVEGKVLFDERLLDTMGEETYRRRIPIPPEVLPLARDKRLNGECVRVLSFRFEGSPKAASARLFDYIKIFTE